MAQTGFTPIQIYSSSTAAAAPTAGNLANSTLGSELAINITDGKLFYKDNANAIQVIGWKVVPTSAGGTGLTSYTAGDLTYYASGTAFTKLAIGASGRYLSSSGTAPQWTAPAALTRTNDTNVTLTLGGSASTALLNAASITVGWTGALATGRGGTGQTSYAVGDILFANTSTTLAKLADVATGNALISGGVGVAPSYGKIGLTTHVSGVLPVANGGTGSTTAAAARTALGATTLGSNLFTITNPSAIRFPRFNADNTVSSLDAASFRTAIGAGTSSTTGTVTSVATSGTVSGLTLTGGPITTTGTITLGGTLAVLPSNFASQTAKTVLAAPNAAAGVPTFRLLVASDIPTLNQNTTGTAAISTAATVTTSATASAFKVPFANTTASTTGNYGLLQDSEATFTYNPSTNTLVAGTFSGALSGNATTATTLQTARTIGGVSFNGSANINLPGVNTAGNQNTTGTAANVTGTVAIANGGTNASTASITSFNNITGYTATGATGTTSTNLVFSTSPSITTPTLVGDVTMSTGNLVVGTSGKGIDFSATPGTGTSELLADYEEGTWTPTLTGSSTNPTVTYILQRGIYTKIGRLVTIECFVKWSAFSGGSGDLLLSALPFTTDSSVGAYGGGAISQLDGITFSAGRTAANMQPLANTTTAIISTFGSAVNTTPTGVSQVAASGSIIFTLTYST
jgi:hypothetical protein